MTRRDTSQKILLGIFPALLVLAVAFSAPAAAPNYFTRTWQVEQGLPQNKVTAVVQTRDGYLWVETCNRRARIFLDEFLRRHHVRKRERFKPLRRWRNVRGCF